MTAIAWIRVKPQQANSALSRLKATPIPVALS
jgi:hypothetical protein